MEDILNIAQEIFCKEYVSNGGNGTKAVEVAYPSIKAPESRAVQSSRLLKQDKVKLMIDKLCLDRKAKIEVIDDEILDKKKEIAKITMTKLLQTYKECENDGDINKMARTLLEMAGELGAKPQTAIQINMGEHGLSLKQMGILDLMKLEKDVKEEIQLKLNTPMSTGQTMLEKLRAEVPIDAEAQTS
jgi:hypothetical protein